MVHHQIVDITFELKEEHDFSWLSTYGEVFAVFDQQDSGNISFGIQKGERKLFIKYAGAKTIHFKGNPEEAVARLKDCVPVYEDLAHPIVVNMVESFSVGEGFAVVFEWVEGEGLHPHWSFPPPHKFTDPCSPFYQFRMLSVEKRVSVMTKIIEFHTYVESKSYVAVDFYDGSLLYDFARDEVRICDIDYYQKRPFTNQMGRLYGSSRFMSPEEFMLHAPIDEVTNVFNMGATAFVLLGRGRDFSNKKWEAGSALYEVAKKAVAMERGLRYQSVALLFEAWRRAEELPK
ncbi:serine/threonine protein kinase [Alkalihalobacillus pseudalcaliphilus]|uniref:serine/threonine protein kinase n=1 Tax=Alkalihalobacillus pseudalcaliphilus TaxID=79884 RepID=UPI00064DB27C|nr:serine/threonine protein kinase [Alkalihalobacillus pseudalcaliphilus]KMK74651.1 serine/threonine protein kinase [Alkalihalobacillus pseudalcaliphilus]